MWGCKLGAYSKHRYARTTNHILIQCDHASQFKYVSLVYKIFCDLKTYLK